MRRIFFPKIPGRSYAYRSTAETGVPDPETGVRVNPPDRGTQDNEISAPSSKVQVGGTDGPNPGREYIGRTSDDLDTGPRPDRIDRQSQALNAGNIGRQMGGWPYDGNALYMVHQRIPRKPITVTPFARTIDTGVTVPSVQIGGPIE